MMMETAKNESELVTEWRLGVLVNAGYPNGQAEILAARHEIDLHVCVELVEKGCDPVTATEIMA